MGILCIGSSPKNKVFNYRKIFSFVNEIFLGRDLKATAFKEVRRFEG